MRLPPIRVICDSCEVASGVPAMLRERGVRVEVAVLRQTGRSARHERETAGLVRAPRADYLFVRGPGVLLAAIERKTRTGLWSDHLAREASGAERLGSQLAAVARLPSPFLVVEGVLARMVRHREGEVRRLLEGARSRGITVVEVRGRRDTARLIEGHWLTLSARAACAGGIKNADR